MREEQIPFKDRRMHQTFAGVFLKEHIPEHEDSEEVVQRAAHWLEQNYGVVAEALVDPDLLRGETTHKIVAIRPKDTEEAVVRRGFDEMTHRMMEGRFNDD